jgi:hypothetical protein
MDLKPFQFGLGTLFVAMAAVAVTAGFPKIVAGLLCANLPVSALFLAIVWLVPRFSKHR